jgi:hypothetical protein
MQTTAGQVRSLARKHPDWTVSQLAEHTGWTYQRVQSALRAGSDRRGPRDPITVGTSIKQNEARREKLLRAPPGKNELRRLNALRLVAVLLQRRAGATVAELIDELGCSRATLYRYRDDAVAAGLQITVAAEQGGEGTWQIKVPR